VRFESVEAEDVTELTDEFDALSAAPFPPPLKETSDLFKNSLGEELEAAAAADAGLAWKSGPRSEASLRLVALMGLDGISSSTFVRDRWRFCRDFARCKPRRPSSSSSSILSRREGGLGRD
jgi:hypothetical protein